MKYLWSDEEISKVRRELQGRPISEVSLQEVAEISEQARWDREQFITSDGQGNIASSWDIAPVKPMSKDEFLKRMRL